MNVTLSWPECEIAAYAGMKRRLLAVHDKRAGQHGFRGDPWDEDIEACGAELAVARLLDMFWTPWARKPADVAADVGAKVQVRRTNYEKNPHLIVRPSDHDAHLFVLVTGDLPNFKLEGWVYGAEAKLDRYWGDPFGTGRDLAWWMPAADMHPPDALIGGVL